MICKSLRMLQRKVLGQGQRGMVCASTVCTICAASELCNLNQSNAHVHNLRYVVPLVKSHATLRDKSTTSILPEDHSFWFVSMPSKCTICARPPPNQFV